MKSFLNFLIGVVVDLKLGFPIGTVNQFLINVSFRFSFLRRTNGFMDIILIHFRISDSLVHFRIWDSKSVLFALAFLNFFNIVIRFNCQIGTINLKI